MSGFVAISRGVFDHEAFAPEVFTEREAWIWMIAEAAWKPHKKRVGGGVVSLERGQLAHSIRFMATRWRWSKSKVERFLSRLESHGMVAKKSGHTSGQFPGQFSGQITICNFDVYQNARDTNGTAGGTASGTGAGQTRTKEQISSEPKGSSDKRATRLSENWQPDELFAAREGLTAFEIKREAETFRDYWAQQPGARGVKLDWQAAWRNWVRRCVKGRRSSSLPPQERIPGFNKF